MPCVLQPMMTSSFLVTPIVGVVSPQLVGPDGGRVTATEARRRAIVDSYCGNVACACLSYWTCGKSYTSLLVLTVSATSQFTAGGQSRRCPTRLHGQQTRLRGWPTRLCG